VTPGMKLESPLLAGGVLIAAGAYELSPLKWSCLRQCQHPLGFLMAHWRPGIGGALRMGARHGLFCPCCCWGLMMLLFVGGVMDLLWIAGLAALALLQKVLPLGRWAARVTGVAGILAGLLLLVPRLVH